MVEALTSWGRAGGPEQHLQLSSLYPAVLRDAPHSSLTFWRHHRACWWQCSCLAGVAAPHTCECPTLTAEKSELHALFWSRQGEISACWAPTAMPKSCDHSSDPGLRTSALSQVQEKGPKAHLGLRRELFWQHKKDMSSTVERERGPPREAIYFLDGQSPLGCRPTSTSAGFSLVQQILGS